jgi:hypothetical protein
VETAVLLQDVLSTNSALLVALLVILVERITKEK